jgi:hypothetical protein
VSFYYCGLTLEIEVRTNFVFYIFNFDYLLISTTAQLHRLLDDIPYILFLVRGRDKTVD